MKREDDEEAPLPMEAIFAFARRWWAIIVTLVGVSFTLYGNVQAVESHSKRLDRLESLMLGVAINSAIACGNNPGCVSFDSMVAGRVDVTLRTGEQNK